MALAAGELRYFRIAGRAAQSIHGDLDGALQIPGVRGIDFFLQLALLGDERVHLLGRNILA